MKNILGREIPEFIEGYGQVKPFKGAYASNDSRTRTTITLRSVKPGDKLDSGDAKLLASIEEEEGSEASAKEINEIAGLVKEYSLPVIFTEVNGSDATANAISRETGCQVAQLTMLMDGPEEGDLSTYLEGVRSNVNTIVSFFGGEELDQL